MKIDRISRFNLIDLKRECVKRGIPFDQVCKLSIFSLQGWLLKNFYNKINNNRLQLYDKWMNIQLIKSDNRDLIYPCFNLAPQKLTPSKVDIISKIKNKKKKVEKTEPLRSGEKLNGIRAGTKKSLTVELLKRGLPKPLIIRKVIKQFPDANLKSINIWIKRYENEPKG